MKKFLRGFTFAWAGISHGFKTERNFKIHVFSAVTVILLGIVTKLSFVEWFIVLILIGGMLALELMNTAVERLVDLATEEVHPLAKQAKDVAAGAVLVFAFMSAVIGLLLFMPKWLKMFL